jgi:heat shock protein HslJ
MPSSSFPCLAVLALLVAATSCSYNPAERPTTGPVASTNSVAAASPLQDVRWELREIGGQPAPATEQTPYLLLHEEKARVEGRAACNRFSGPYVAAGGSALRLGPLATTRSACPDLAAEGAFLQALNQAQHFRISGSTLSLFSEDTLGVPLARLEAVPEK